MQQKFEAALWVTESCYNVVAGIPDDDEEEEEEEGGGVLEYVRRLGCSYYVDVYCN